MGFCRIQWENAGMTHRPITAVLAFAFLGAAALQAGAQQKTAPQAQKPQAAASVLPAGNVEHGRYIAEHVAMCIECHSGRDANGNILQNELFEGGSIPFAPPWPNDWANRAPRNKGLPGYTDEQALRLLTQGAIGRDGKQLRPPMPRFRMTPQDAADVIAFLRSLP
jgi:mono/diheme cytochrome c family protein